MHNSHSAVGLIGCNFTGNSATRDGGGVSNSHSTVDLTGCSFSDNSGSGDGGDIYASYGNVIINTCPVGYFGTTGKALDTKITGEGTITGQAKSYLCSTCVG